MLKLPLLTAIVLAASLTGRAQVSDLLCHNYIGAEDALEMCVPYAPSELTVESRAWDDARARAGIDPQGDGVRALEAFIDRYPGGPYETGARILLAECLLTEHPELALEVLEEVRPGALSPDARALYCYHLGYARMMLGDFGAAETEFRSAARSAKLRNDARFFQGYLAYRQDRYNEALELMSHSDRRTLPGAMADFYTAQMLYAQGDLSAAEKSALAAVNTPVAIPEEYRAEAMRIAGEAAYEAGRRGDGVNMLRQYRRMAENPARSAMYILGTEEFMSGNNAEAVTVLESVVSDADAMGQSALLYIGQALTATGSHDAALSAFSRAMAMDYDPAVTEAAFYNYAVSRMSGARLPFSSTTEVFEDFLTRFPDGRYAPMVQEYLVTGYLTDHNYDDALASINRMKTMTPRISAAKQQVLYALGTRALAAGDDDAAIRYLDEARTLAHNDRATDARVALSRGEALYRKGRYAEAATDAEYYLKNAPADDESRSLARYDLGYALLAQKKYKEAGAEFSRAASSSGDLDAPARADALNRLADTELYGGKFEEALADYSRAYELRQSAGDYPLFQQGVIYGFMNRPEQKIGTLRRMMDEFPTSSLVPDAMLETTEAYTRTGNRDAALEMYRRLVTTYPSTEQGRRGYLQMALTRLNAGDRAGAIADYRSIVTLYPTSEEARMAVDQLKSLSAEDGTLGATAAWLETVENAPRMDIAEADALTFRVAEKDWLTEQRTERLEKYLTDYPAGASRSTALAYMMDAAVADGRTGDALTYADRILAEYPDSRNVESALHVKADALHELGHGKEALEAYSALEQRASNPKVRNAARMGVMRVARDLADNPRVIEMAEALLASTAAGDDGRTEVEFSLAQALDLTGQTDKARAMWTPLSSRTDDLYGAKSAVALGQSYYDSGDMEAARRAADALIDAATPHTYWLARAFILLSDVYAATGQTFEAREYLLSLKDNYPGDETDIFQMINTRLSSLK
ncbi:MAG: tetratricopeptide repeat protein [Muribaculaceae bacterium]|nr:tetratricopeptide repeat protein [Muribaculaceae bacterium]